MSVAIITASDLLSYLGTDSGQAENKELDFVVAGVNSFLAGTCGLVEDIEDRVEPLDIETSYTRKLLLDFYPVKSFTSLLEGRGTQTVVDPSNYVVNMKLGIITRVIGFWFTGGYDVGVGQYTANYKAGIGSIPDDLKLAALRIAAREYFKASKNRHGLKGVGFIQGNSEYFLTDIEDMEKALLADFISTRVR